MGRRDLQMRSALLRQYARRRRRRWERKGFSCVTCRRVNVPVCKPEHQKQCFSARRPAGSVTGALGAGIRVQRRHAAVLLLSPAANFRQRPQKTTTNKTETSFCTSKIKSGGVERQAGSSSVTQGRHTGTRVHWPAESAVLL